MRTPFYLLVTAALVSMPPPAPKFVGVSGNQFTLGGHSFKPLALNDCVLRGRVGGPGAGPTLVFGMDGGFRSRGEPENFVDATTYFRAYRDAGFNIFRLGVCGAGVGNDEALLDEAIDRARENGFAVWLVVFQGPLPDARSARLKVRHAAERYAGRVDLWEITNEEWPDLYALSEAISELRAADPYDHPVTSTWTSPAIADHLDFISPHYYTDDGSGAIERAVSEARVLAGRKPILFGELGRFTVNWGPDQASLLGAWFKTAERLGVYLGLWNTGNIKDYFGPGSSNTYLGPEERALLARLTSSAPTPTPPPRTVPGVAPAATSSAGCGNWWRPCPR